jgi:hypothetical protein
LDEFLSEQRTDQSRARIYICIGVGNLEAVQIDDMICEWLASR